MPTFNMPSLPGLDFSKLDLSKVQLPKFDIPKFDIPKFDIPKFEMPAVELPAVDVERLGDLARDAAYAGVGLVALTVQKVDEARRVIGTELATRGRQLVDAIA